MNSKRPEDLLVNNKAWAQGISADNPSFFADLSQQQTPEYLWIGCSDSRVPATQVSGLGPGEMFVHRNISNMVKHNDPNCMSVVQYAVTVLKVRRIIVCGHYQCGGVAAAMQDNVSGFIDDWLFDLRQLWTANKAQLSLLSDADALTRLCELNVLHQLSQLAQTNLVTDAWTNGQELSLHGWIYSLADGQLTDLGATLTQPDDIQLIDHLL